MRFKLKYRQIKSRSKRCEVITQKRLFFGWFYSVCLGKCLGRATLSHGDSSAGPLEADWEQTCWKEENRVGLLSGPEKWQGDCWSWESSTLNPRCVAEGGRYIRRGFKEVRGEMPPFGKQSTLWFEVFCLYQILQERDIDTKITMEHPSLLRCGYSLILRIFMANVITAYNSGKVVR